MRAWVQRYKTATKVEGSEQGQALLRVALEIPISLYAVYLVHSGAAAPSLIYFLLFAISVGALLFAHIMYKTEPIPLRRCIGIIIDQSLITLLLFQTGVAGAMYFFIFTFTTIGNGFRYGIRYLIFSGSCSVIGLLVLIHFCPHWEGDSRIGYGLMLTHIMVTGYTGVLLARLRANVQQSKIAEAERAELLVREKTALEASVMKSAFLANMSHELRTPINGVLGMADLMRGTPMTSEQKSYAEIISQSAETLLVLVNDILDLSKAEAGKIEIETLDVDLKKLIAGLEKHVAFTASKKGLKLSISLSDELPQFLLGDPNRLRQVLLNLVSNAIKFTEKGSVEIKAHLQQRSAGEKMVQFDIFDTGIGVSEETMPKLFTAFSQADATTTRKFGGSGLGLSISRHLVHLMGGDIGVERRASGGMHFWFTVPFAAGAGSQIIAQVSQATVAADVSYKILVAEDNPTNQIIITKILQKLGHEPTLAANGVEVLEKLSNQTFDFVFMDCQMPLMDGYAATKSIRENQTAAFRNIPIIALTANAMRGDREKCLDAGMSDYVSKPIKSTDIQTVISRVMTAA